MTIQSITGQNLAMDGQNYRAVSQSLSAQSVGMADGAEAAQNIAQSQAEARETAQQLQRLSDMVIGRRSLRFSINEELGNVVISVMDPSTNRVIRQIPSEDIQKMKVNMRKAIGLLFDEMI